MSPMWCILVNVRCVVFDSIYLLNFEITQRYRKYKHKNLSRCLLILTFGCSTEFQDTEWLDNRIASRADMPTMNKEKLSERIQ
jgi:hypothetical protein